MAQYSVGGRGPVHDVQGEMAVHTVTGSMARYGVQGIWTAYNVGEEFAENAFVNAALSVIGTLAASGVKGAQVSGFIVGVGTLVADFSETGFVTVQITGVGQLAASGSGAHTGASFVQGSGVLAGAGTSARFQTGNILGIGSLVLTGAKNVSVSALAQAVGQVAASVRKNGQATAQGIGVGQVECSTIPGHAVSGFVQGLGISAAAGNKHALVSGNVFGIGSLEGSGVDDSAITGSGTIDGIGLLQSSVSKNALVSAAGIGIGTLASSAFKLALIGANNLGIGTLAASGTKSVADTFRLYPTAQATGNTASSVYTSGSLAIGPEVTGRYVVAVVTTQENADFDAVTIGGVSATKLVDGIDTGSNPDMLGDIWWAAVPTGTTAVVTATLSTADDSVAVTLFHLSGHNTTASDTDSASGSAATISLTGLTIPDGGGAVLGFSNNTDTTAVTWTGAQECYDVDGGTHRHSSAMRLASGTPTITADGATANQALVGVAFARANSANGGVDANTKLLLHGFGIDGGSVIADSSPSGHVITNTAVIDTDQFVFEPSSILFSSTSITPPASSDFSFSTGDFDVSTFVRFSSTPTSGNNATFMRYSQTDPNEGWWFCLLNDSGTLKLQLYFSSVTLLISENWTPSTGVWYWVRVARSGTTLGLYVDGSQLGSTVTNSTNLNSSGPTRQIGTGLSGWMQELRVIKGAVGTGTVPTVPYS